MTWHDVNTKCGQLNITKRNYYEYTKRHFSPHYKIKLNDRTSTLTVLEVIGYFKGIPLKDSEFAVKEVEFAVKEVEFAVRESEYAVRESEFAVKESGFAVKEVEFTVTLLGHRRFLKSMQDQVIFYSTGALCRASTAVCRLFYQTAAVLRSDP